MTSTPLARDSVKECFQDKRVLVTGHTGFKGAWLSLWLSELGAEVAGYGLAPNGDDGLYSYLRGTAVFHLDHHGDILDQPTFRAFLKRCEPDYVFHLAAQPLVRLSYVDLIGTLTTNVVGSAIVWDAIRELGKKCHTIL